MLRKCSTGKALRYFQIGVRHLVKKEPFRILSFEKFIRIASSFQSRQGAMPMSFKARNQMETLGRYFCSWKNHREKPVTYFSLLVSTDINILTQWWPPETLLQIVSIQEFVVLGNKLRSTTRLWLDNCLLECLNIQSIHGTCWTCSCNPFC